tara:strand:- start:21 stop:248 length:228 start_codon:yes stop_codon:yes gene_type:complete
MKKILVNKENPNGIEVDLNAEELAQRETDNTNFETAKAQTEADIQAKADLKASAKAKLIAGEALTEDEANILVGV